MNRRGFTLLELLIVIAILAVLATVAVLVISPLEYLKQSRDTKRIADMTALNKALAMAEFNGINMGGASTTVFVSLVNATADCAGLGLPPLPIGYTYKCVTTSADLRKTDGTGWIPVNLGGITGGAPLAALPTDPVNNATSFYTYIPGGSFALSAILESQKFMQQSGVKDGGANPAKFEVGSDLALLTNAEGLVGYWPFDEGTGTIANDMSGRGHDGSFTDAPAWVAGKIGTALSFDGIDDYVSVPNHADLAITDGNMSIAFWTVQYYPHPTTYPRIMGKGDYNTGGWQVIIDRTNNNAVFQSFQSGAGQSVSLGTIANTEFMHVAITKTGTTVKTYINGALRTTGSITNPAVSTRPLTIGASHPVTTTELAKGVIDDVRFYNRALSPEEVGAIYSATK